MANELDIVERTFAFSRRVKRLCGHLRDEARESHFWLRQREASGAFSPERIADLTDEARQLKLILAAIINSTRQGMKEDKRPDSEKTEADDD